MATKGFVARDGERDTLDIPPSDARAEGDGEIDEFSKFFGTTTCWTCGRRASEADIEDCEKQGPGRVGCGE